MEPHTLSSRIEAASAAYAERNGIDRTDDWLILKLNEEVGELTQAYLAATGRARDKGLSHDDLDRGLRAELADVLAHTLLLARRFEVDLSDEVERKWMLRDE